MQKIEDAYSQSINRLIIIDHEVIFIYLISLGKLTKNNLS